MKAKTDNLTCTIRLDESKQRHLMDLYKEYECPKPSIYVLFFAKGKDFSVTLYEKEDQGKRKAVFQGSAAQQEANLFGEEVTYAIPLKKTPKVPYFFFDQVGSDEVGTGDFFGPIVVCAAFCDRKMLSLIQQLGITDSKKLTDEFIKQTIPQLLKDADYSCLTLDNEKYNELQQDGMNLNKMKAKMHNRALLNLMKRHPSARACIDQFAEENLYYSYLKDEAEVQKDIFFLTKGETHFPSVALASCIARYHFLEKMEELGGQYGVVFPLGAGSKVDSFAKKFVKKHGQEALQKVAKLNFKNAERI